jgi:DNA-binding NtrC family response regulator
LLAEFPRLDVGGDLPIAGAASAGSRLSGGAMHQEHILVVDRTGDVREVVAALVDDLGYRVSAAKDAETARAILDADSIDLIVLDASTATMGEINVAIEAKDPGIRLVMISGHPGQMEAFHDRADQLVWKPFRPTDLERAIGHAFASETFGQRREDPELD